MPSSPGTVSKILWHFTGGPRWDSARNRQEDQPKPVEEAYSALLSILRSRELRIGNYREVLKVLLPVDRRWDPTTSTVIEEHNIMKQLESDPVCCLADIPIVHLDYHSERYGKIAIGLHRKSAIHHGFNPVLYQLHSSPVLLAIYQTFAELGDADTTDMENVANNLESELSGLQCEEGHDVDVDTSSLLGDLETGLHYLTSSLSSAIRSFDSFLAFVKTFDENEFGTIYCEREWRSTRPFSFDYSDISMIALPRNTDNGDHYERFLRDAGSIPLPRNVSIVAWDDLVEH